MEMKWYTIYTKLNSEKKVASFLERKNILHFCPSALIPERLRKLEAADNLTRYVFVNIAEKQITELKKINGVINFLHWQNKPAVIDEIEIELMKSFLKKYTNIQIKRKHVTFDLIVDHYHTSQNQNEGKIVAMNNNKIYVTLPSLGYIMSGEFEKLGADLFVPDEILKLPKFKMRYKIAT